MLKKKNKKRNSEGRGGFGLDLRVPGGWKRVNWCPFSGRMSLGSLGVPIASFLILVRIASPFGQVEKDPLPWVFFPRSGARRKRESFQVFSMFVWSTMCVSSLWIGLGLGLTEAPGQPTAPLSHKVLFSQRPKPRISSPALYPARCCFSARSTTCPMRWKAKIADAQKEPEWESNPSGSVRSSHWLGINHGISQNRTSAIAGDVGRAQGSWIQECFDALRLCIQGLHSLFEPRTPEQCPNHVEHLLVR